MSVNLYEVTTGAPSFVGSAVTVADGRFWLRPSRSASDSVFYAAAASGDGVRLVTGDSSEVLLSSPNGDETGGPAHVAFDRRGYAWITNNVALTPRAAAWAPA